MLFGKKVITVDENGTETDGELSRGTDNFVEKSSEMEISLNADISPNFTHDRSQKMKLIMHEKKSTQCAKTIKSRI